MHEPPSHINTLDLLLEQRECYRTWNSERTIGTQPRNDALPQTTRVRGLKRERSILRSPRRIQSLENPEVRPRDLFII